MRGILWHMARKLEGIFDGILMEFHTRISEDKNHIQKLMYIPWYLSSGLYSRAFHDFVQNILLFREFLHSSLITLFLLLNISFHYFNG